MYKFQVKKRTSMISYITLDVTSTSLCTRKMLLGFSKIRTDFFPHPIQDYDVKHALDEKNEREREKKVSEFYCHIRFTCAHSEISMQYFHGRMCAMCKPRMRIPKVLAACDNFSLCSRCSCRWCKCC